MSTYLPQTLIVRQEDIPDLIWKYEKQGYQLKSMKPLQNEVSIYALQFFKFIDKKPHEI